jgi:deoxyribonuclease V
MEYKLVHTFEPEIAKMLEIQNSFKEKIIFRKLEKSPEIVSGVDLSIMGDYGLSVIVTFNFKTLEIIDIVYAREKLQMEYIPGFLAFRELPVFIKAWEKLKINPDIVFFDGHGYAHPRRMGIATHASFFIGRPTVGIGKSRLTGKFEEPGPEKGNYSYLYHKNEIIGAVLRTKLKVNPVFISAGNYITLDEAINYSLQLTTKYRLPEVTRITDAYTKKLKSEFND